VRRRVLFLGVYIVYLVSCKSYVDNQYKNYSILFLSCGVFESFFVRNMLSLEHINMKERKKCFIQLIFLKPYIGLYL